MRNLHQQNKLLAQCTDVPVLIKSGCLYSSFNLKSAGYFTMNIQFHFKKGNPITIPI